MSTLPHRQLRWAHLWSVVGMLPFRLFLCWTLALFATFHPGQPPAIPMLGLGLACFLFMLAVAGPQLFWAWHFTSHYPELQSKTALLLRVLASTLLLSPWWITLLPA